jgi:hypothetical protein
VSEPETGVVQGLRVVSRIAPELATGYSWRLRILQIAPYLRLGVPWSLYRVALETTSDSEHWRVNLRIGTGMELSLTVYGDLWVVASAGIGTVVFRDRFRRASDHSIERAAAVESAVAIGVKLVF